MQEKRLRQLQAVNNIIKFASANDLEIKILLKELYALNEIFIDEYIQIVNYLNELLECKVKVERIKRIIYSGQSLQNIADELRILLKVLEKEEVDFKTAVGIKKIIYGEQFNYIETTRNMFATYFKLEINELLDLVGEDVQLNYIRNFYSILDVASDNLSVYYLDKDIKFERNIQNVLRQLKEPQNQNVEFQHALKSDLRKFVDLKEKIKNEKQVIMMIDANT